MCLMLYLATADDQALRASPDLRVEEVQPSRSAVRQWFSLPTVRFVGAHTGCSCGFPSFIADQPVGYYDGIFQEHENREADLRSVRSLVDLIRTHVSASGEVELYPVAAGDERAAPKGTIVLDVENLAPDTFLLTEQFLYRITRTDAGARRR